MAARSEVLAALKGQQVRVPDLQALLQEWPQRTSSHVEKLQVDVDAKLEELMPAGKRLQQMKKGNVAHFTATWWPYAEYEQSKNIAYLSIWLFNWDDETDSMEYSNMADHFDAEQRFRQDTLAFIRQCLSPVPADVSVIEEPENITIEAGRTTPVSGSSRSSSSNSAAAEASSNSSSPSTGTSTEDPSPRNSTTTPQKISASRSTLTRAASVTKATSMFKRHVRRPSTAPQAASRFPISIPETEGNDIAKSKPEEVGPTSDNLKSSAPGTRPRRTSFRSFATAVAKYFRPRKDSAVDMSGPEPISEEAEVKEEVASAEPSRSPLILSFKTIADSVCPHLSPHEHRRFLLECEKFINATEREQALRVRGVLPGIEEYIAMRMDTGGVAICVAMHEYGLGIQLPNAIREDQEMAQIWLQTSMIICIVNDMLSIKKEIAQDETDSLLPILVGQGKSPQAAMDHAFGMVQSAKWALDAAARRLSEKARASYSEQTCCDLDKFVDSCRMACTGSTVWSIESGRYKIGVPSLKGGVMICLE